MCLVKTDLVKLGFKKKRCACIVKSVLPPCNNQLYERELFEVEFKQNDIRGL